MWPCQRMETLDLNFWCTRFSDPVAGRNPICREGLGGAVTDFSFFKLKSKGLAWPGGTFSLSLQQEKVSGDHGLKSLTQLVGHFGQPPGAGEKVSLYSDNIQVAPLGFAKRSQLALRISGDQREYF